MKKFIPILLLAGSTLLAGCGDSNNDFNFNGNNYGVVAAPVARNDAYTTNQNVPTSIPLAQGVLANDTLNAGPNSNITVNFPATTAQGGTVSLGDNFGGFTYTPANGFNGTDSFTYTLSNGFSSASATVSITVTAAQVTQGFFVDSANGSDTTGNFQTGAPFQTIQAAVTAAGAGADIVVRPGNYAGAINLLNGQRLLGSGSILVNAQGTVRPSLTGPVILADGNTVDFVKISGTNGDAIDGDDQNGGTVTNCEISNTINLGSAVRLRSVTGNWTIEDNTITNVAGTGIDMDTDTGDNVTARVNRNKITGTPFPAIVFVSALNSALTVQLNDNVLTGNSVGATVQITAGDSSVSCYQILGNQNDDVYLLDQVQSATGTFNIEQLNNLGTLNTGTFQTSGGNKPPTSVPAGFCGF